jgi:hypothetical protein
MCSNLQNQHGMDNAARATATVTPTTEQPFRAFEFGPRHVFETAKNGVLVSDEDHGFK